MLGLESVLAPGQGAGRRGADHPGAALPGQPRDRVLVPRRLGNLEHHLVALKLAGEIGGVMMMEQMMTMTMIVDGDNDHEDDDNLNDPDDDGDDNHVDDDPYDQDDDQNDLMRLVG